MFRVIWMPHAFDRMAEIVRANPHLRHELAAALRAIAVRLRVDPHKVGESRDPPFRVGFFDPITVTFRTADDQQTTYVTDVHLPE